MAQTGYTEGVTEVAPREESPNDYQSGRGADIEAFGGAMDQGLQKLGQGALTSSKFFGQVAADSASNDFQDYATKLLHGDPNKTVPGPDGQPMPDTGYLGLRGRAALDARPNVSKALDDRLKSTRESLTSPEQQLQFDNFSRRYRAMVDQSVGSHADGQATTWYQGVNTASAKLALDHISNNADKPQEYLAGESDLVHAYVKNAQLQGAQPGDPQYQEAVAAGRRDALKARLDAVAVKNPLQAQAILDKPENKAIAGQYYDNMSSAYRGRAKQTQGYGIAETTWKDTYANSPAVNLSVLSSAGARYGVSTSYLVNTQHMETGNNPNQISPTGAKGPFQFVGSTARQVGLKDPFNYEESADRAAYLASQNQVQLTTSLGRPASDPELYIAHNQGAAGAAKLLTNPNARAGDLVGDQAIRVNGGDPNAPAIAFTSMMTNKFMGAPASAIQNRKAQSYQAILSQPDMDPDVREHALNHLNQMATADAIAQEQDAKSKKAATDQVQSDLVTEIIRGGSPDTIAKIANSALPANEKENLYKFATGEGGIDDPLRYGPGYTDTLKRVLAPSDDPSRINSPAEVIQMGADHQLSKRGVTEILGTMDKIKKQPDQAGIATVKSSQLQYYKSKMAIDDEMSAITGKPYKNQKGLDRFNHDFVPAFETAYSQWVAKGKDPMEFLNDSKQMDSIMDRVYPPAQRAADSVTGAGTTKVNTTVPPAPAGTEPKAWASIIGQPPNAPDGTPIDPVKWAKAITTLRENPTPENIQKFNTRLAPSGYTAEDIFKRLPPAERPTHESGPVPEPDVAPTQPGFLERLREKNRADLQKMEEEKGKKPELHLPGDHGPLDELVKNSASPTNILGVRG